MTNASKVNFLKALSVGVFAIAIAFGAFATIAHAQEADLGFGDFYGDNLGYGDVYGDNLGYGDTYGDNLGYGDIYGDNLGYGDTYGDNLGYGDVYGDNLGYGDTYGDNLGYGDIYGGTCGCDQSSFDKGYTSMAPSFGGQSFGGYGQSFGAKSFPSMPTTFYAPSYHAPSYPAPSYPAPVSNPSVTNVNNNTNTNVNNITNNNNSSAVAIATVTPVAAAPIQYQVQYVQPQPVYQQQPYCTISVTNYNGSSYGPYSYNQLATLSWSSNYATSGYISPNVGQVSGYGSMQVYPQNGQVYSMTVYGQGGTATCSTQPYYIPVAPINPTPYVSLSQIPYTGFDFGALGNAIYWLALLSFAGAAAYLVLYFNGGVVALAGNRSKRSPIQMPAIAVNRVVAQAAQKIETAVVSPIQNVVKSVHVADKMHITHSKDGSAPRIHISRE